MLSPGKTLITSPSFTISDSTILSSPFFIILDVLGVSFKSFSIPSLAFSTVKSSSKAPSCIIKAISPAAKTSLIHIAAISASDTKTSALISNSVVSPIIASIIIGKPQRTIAIQAMLKGNFIKPVTLKNSDIPDITRNVISFFTPPISIKSSILRIKSFI